MISDHKSGDLHILLQRTCSQCQPELVLRSQLLLLARPSAIFLLVAFPFYPFFYPVKIIVCVSPASILTHNKNFKKMLLIVLRKYSKKLSPIWFKKKVQIKLKGSVVTGQLCLCEHRLSTKNVNTYLDTCKMLPPPPRSSETPSLA